MVTHALRGREMFPVRQRLFENQIPANGIRVEEGFQLQQRYDKSKRPVPGRPPSQRRPKNQGIQDRNITPVHVPKQDTAPDGVQ